jgi:hypothetical protein
MTAWQKFLEDIQIARHQICASRSKAWYRGVSSISYPLYPSLFGRSGSPGISRERDLYLDFVTRFRGKPSSWEDLCDMQHQGIPTRLLDWSEVLGVALHFALGSKDKNPSSPCVWILNPFTLAANARKSDDKTIGVFHMNQEMDYYKSFIDLKNWPYSLPFPYHPLAVDGRILAQRGFFTVHGNCDKPLSESCRKHIRRVELPLEAIPDARKFLEYAGIDELSMFPDPSGMARKIKQDYMPKI